jgi:hypothetical protein
MKRSAKFRALLAIYLSLKIVPLFGLESVESETVLYRFQGASDGAVPYGLVFDRQGNAYGTTQLRGDGSCTYPNPGCGAVFEASPVTDGDGKFTGSWNKKLIYVFRGGQDGYGPVAPLALDESGNLFGATVYGGGTTGCGGAGCGTVFELSRRNGCWVETVLYRFTGGADGGSPESSVTIDRAGNIFGTTFNGGLKQCKGFPCGVAYELQRSASGWRETVLHSFDFKDGSQPIGGLILDSSGNLFGTTAYGGPPYPPDGAGTIFALKPSPSGWEFEVLYSFPEFDGNPTATMTLDGNGNLYGTANGGGAFGYGSVFELQRPTSQEAAWNFSNLYSFTLGQDGGFPYGGVAFDSAGNLYGPATGGGIIGPCQIGCGVVFKLAPSAGRWTESVLYSFQGGADGINPNSTPVLDPLGNLYGTTAYGGDTNCIPFPDYSGCGTVFRINHAAISDPVQGIDTQ